MDDPDPVRKEHLAAGAIYGVVAYLAILVLLEEDHTDPKDAIAILVGSAIVYWLAHVYAHLLPRMAAAGRLRSGRFWETAADQIGILAVVIVPVFPLALGVIGFLSGRTAVRAAIAAGVASLGVFAIWQARESGLTWGRSLVIAAGLLLAGIGLLWLEVSLH